MMGTGAGKRIIGAARAAALMIMILLAAACCGAPAYHKYEYTFFGTFDTVVQLIGYTRSQTEFDAWAAKAEARFAEFNRLFDMYHDYPGVTNFKTINDNAGMTPVKVSKEIIALLQFCKEWNARCPGVINPAFGAVLEIWREYRERALAEPAQAALPPAEALRAAAQHTDFRRVIVDEAASTVFLEDPEMRLDVGSVAKGYATELVARELKAQGFESFVLNSGGNVRAVGKPLDGRRERWGVGITDPDEPGSGVASAAILDTAYVADIAVTTAGDYQRYYTVNGVRYSHIIDPGTCMPATRFRSVTVTAPDSGVADYLDTLLFILPYEDGRKLAQSLDGVDVLWVLPDGTLKATDGMKTMLGGMGRARAD